MCNEKARRMKPTNSRAAVRVELVDNWHAFWPQVLEAIAEQGELEALSIDADGWLSARQVLLVAFARGAIVGHLCFRLAPGADSRGKLGIDARLEAFGIYETSSDSQTSKIASALRRAALQRARALRCRELIGFAA